MPDTTNTTARAPQAHTPGPWATFDAVDGIEIMVANESPVDKRASCKQWICALNHKCEWVSRTEVMANAALIASAPELFAALNRLQANPNDPRAHRQALDAIALATKEAK